MFMMLEESVGGWKMMGKSVVGVIIIVLLSSFVVSNYLISDTSNFRVVEVDNLGRVVWEFNGMFIDFTEGRMFSLLARPNYAVRLEDGGTLITESGLDNILIVNTSHYNASDLNKGFQLDSIIWNYSGVQDPIMAVEASVDTLLITDRSNNRIVEVDRAGDIVWEYSLPVSFNSALQYGDRVLVSYKGDNSRTRVVFFDKDTLDVVWECNYSDIVTGGDVSYAMYTGENSVLLTDVFTGYLLEFSLGSPSLDGVTESNGLWGVVQGVLDVQSQAHVDEDLDLYMSTIDETNVPYYYQQMQIEEDAIRDDETYFYSQEIVELKEVDAETTKAVVFIRFLTENLGYWEEYYLVTFKLVGSDWKDSGFQQYFFPSDECSHLSLAMAYETLFESPAPMSIKTVEGFYVFPEKLEYPLILAPSDITTRLKFFPRLWRCFKESHTSSISVCISGTRIISAPPAIPASTAIHPVCSPITSITIMR